MCDKFVCADTTARLKNRFLSHVTKSWKDVNNEVMKSLSHFEGLLGELLVSWYDSEKDVEQASRSDHLLLRAEIKVSLDNAGVTRGEQAKEVLRRYHILEPNLVGEIFERRVGGDGKERVSQSNGYGHNSTNGPDEEEASSRHMLSESRQTVSVSDRLKEDDGDGMSVLSHAAGGNQFDLDSEGKGNNLAMLKGFVRAALEQAHSRLEEEKRNLCLIVKHNRKKR
jgi:hypothetical protein